jgi:hypothetical protein
MSLNARIARYPHPFTSITGIRELSNGRVFVLDKREAQVELLDMASGTSKVVGRVGSGPGEYRAPLRLIPLPGDSVGLEDMAGFRRLLVFTGSGEARGTIPISAPDNARNPEASDSEGRLYSLHSPGPSVKRRDSSHIVRISPRSGRQDTVAQLKTHVFSSIPLSPAPGVGPPFAVSEQWAVAGDGRVAVVSPSPYRVTFFLPGAPGVQGPELPVTRVRVSEALREEWRVQAQRQVMALVKVRGEYEVRWMKAPYREPEAWPDYLPPFLSDAVRFDERGLLWVVRTAPAGVALTADVIDENGVVRYRIVLPKRARLLGFGRRSVYLARLDEDDVEFLEQYRSPVP